MSNATFAKYKVNKISINNIVKSDKNALFFNYISFNNSNSSIDIISNINDNDLHINQLFLTDINIQGIISIKNVKAIFIFPYSCYSRHNIYYVYKR